MYKCFRFTKGMDLKEEIEKYSINNNISGVIISSVGCLNKLVIRLADGESILKKDGNFEIVSIMGTLSPKGVHIHISVSDENGNTIVSASSMELKLKNGGNIEAAKQVGAEIAKKAKKAKITKVVFDRGGYEYHGRVEALADAARENGLEF